MKSLLSALFILVPTSFTYAQWTQPAAGVLTTTSKVGINVTSPAYPLDVSGDANISGLLNGMKISAGNAGTASMCVAIGKDTLKSNTGQGNTAVGYEALSLNQTGISNTAMGLYSLRLSLGSYNTAVGSGSLSSNTTGTQNVALGASALTLNNTGNGNTAIGNGAIIANVAGDYNVAVGDYALKSNIGSNNIGIGVYALQSNTSSIGNIAIGTNSLYDYKRTADTQGYNTVVGHNSGTGIVTGNNNTIIGARVQNLNANLSNNVIIADGAGNRRINVDSNGNVGLGTESPNSRLDVVGAIRADSICDRSGSNCKVLASGWPGSGTVTNIVAGTGLSGGNITTTGTIALTETGVASGTYGSGTQVPVITIDSNGRITSASNVTIAGAGSGGVAGGDLVGNYPNPLLNVTGVVPGTYSKVTVDSKGRINSGSQFTASDIKSAVAGNWLSASGSCGVGEQLTYLPISDTLSCQSYSISQEQVNTALGYKPAPNNQAIRNISTDTTLTASDDVVLVNASSSPVTIALPSAANLSGKTFVVKKIDSTINEITIIRAGAETIDGAISRVLSSQYSNIRMISDGTNWLDISGGSSASILKAPTYKVLTGGSGTYTKPAGVLYLKIKMIGSGGGGSGSGLASTSPVPAPGQAGAPTSFGNNIAGGGGGGIFAGPGGQGGMPTIDNVIDGLAFVGAPGITSVFQTSSATQLIGGSGGATQYGPGGAGGIGTSWPFPGMGGIGAVGAGGGGGSVLVPTAAKTFSGSGGGAGAIMEFIIRNPAATYSYSVGLSGFGGPAGSGGVQGGMGGNGIIEITEYYQ